MNERLAELKELWNKNFDGELTPGENARLAELMADDTLMEAFSERQAEKSQGEAEGGMNEADWKRVDARVMSAFKNRGLKRLIKPLAVLMGTSLAVAGVLWFGSDERQERPDLSAQSESFGVEAPRAAEPAEEAHDSLYEVRAPKISVVVEQAKRGQAAVEILNSNGVRVTRLFSGELGKGNHRFEWNGLDSAGRKVQPGEYRIKIKTSAGTETRNLEIRRKK